MTRDGINWQQRAYDEIAAKQQATQKSDALRQQSLDQERLRRAQEIQPRYNEIQRIAINLGIEQSLNEINKTTRFWSGRGVIKQETSDLEGQARLTFTLASDYPDGYDIIYGEGERNQKGSWIPGHKYYTEHVGRGGSYTEEHWSAGGWKVLEAKIVDIKEKMTHVQDVVDLTLKGTDRVRIRVGGNVQYFAQGGGYGSRLSEEIEIPADTPNIKDALDKALLQRVMARLNQKPLPEAQAEGQRIIAEGRRRIGKWEKLSRPH